MIEADYIIIGAGAVGLAFADTILSESDYSVAIIDRNPKPGGHWNDAYDFVSLHQPSAFYGVNSLQLGSGQIDKSGPNAGLYELASGRDVLAYFDRVIQEVLLPTGRCSYYPGYDFVDQNTAKSRQSGETVTIKAGRKLVDGTYYGTTVPSRHTPAFEIEQGVTLIPPNGLSQIFANPNHGWQHICVIGAGKTAMDAGCWILDNALPAEQISWIVPRDSWLLNRKYTQPGIEFFKGTMGKQAEQMRILGEAKSADDAFLRLEEAGIMLRIDPDIKPTMYHCATISEQEVAALATISQVHRHGRIAAVTGTGLSFQNGTHVDMPEATLYIDCTASAVDKRPAKPVFDGELITLQMLRPCQPTFSAALIAHMELEVEDSAERLQMCTVPPLPDLIDDFLKMTLDNMMNQFYWSQNPGIRQWLVASRLDGFAKVIAAADKEDPEVGEILGAFKQHAPAAVGNLQKLVAAL